MKRAMFTPNLLTITPGELAAVLGALQIIVMEPGLKLMPTTVIANHFTFLTPTDDDTPTLKEVPVPPETVDAVATEVLDEETNTPEGDKVIVLDEYKRKKSKRQKVTNTGSTETTG